MRMIEAVRNRFHQGELRLTESRALKNLSHLQGRTVNLLPVLQKNIPNHAHYKPNWHPDQLKEPESLHSDVLTWQEEPHRTLQMYEDYFQQHGIIDVKMYGNPLTASIIVNRNSDRSDVWPAEKTIDLFPWVDFFIMFEPRIARRNVVRDSGFLFEINATKAVGNLYDIDIPILRREQQWGADRFFISGKSQRLVEDLLAARV